MKKTLFIALSLLLFVGVAEANPKKKKKSEKSVTYYVELDCHMCKAKLEKNLPFEKGFKDMTVDIDKNIVTVKFNPKVTDSITISKAIEELDFKILPATK